MGVKGARAAVSELLSLAVQPTRVADLLVGAAAAGGCRSRSSRNDDRPPGPVAECNLRKLNTAMSYIVSFFAVLNRPSPRGSVRQIKAHTTAEEMIGLL